LIKDKITLDVDNEKTILEISNCPLISAF